MPKTGIELPGSFTGDRSELGHLVHKWIRKRGVLAKGAANNSAKTWPGRKGGDKRALTAMPDAELLFLAYCARWPYFIECDHGSLGSFVFEDGLSGKERAGKLVSLLAGFPDEGAQFWVWIREQRENKRETKLQQAREAVKAVRIDSKWAQSVDGKEIKMYLEKKYGKKWTAMVDEAVTGNRRGPFQGIDIEKYLEIRYGRGFWSKTVEDAIKAERGKVSGRKVGRNTG